MHTNSVAAQRVENVDACLERGDYFIRRGAADVPTAFWFVCPGCGYKSRLSLDGSEPPGRNWKYTGPQDSPTLHPSIHHLECWHGWLKAGQFESC